jgi:GH24 family phage-related lysozyme (muramidase)
MSTQLTISDVGLRLIKAYEGFRPVDIELMSGQRVVGYGHRVMSGESLHLSKEDAEDLLREDLAPYEAMINDSIFAPLSQSQFDALCSLAFNIGPKKFLESDVVRALNNGRLLDAANGFDVWRKAKINNESFIVDALVRRRTAEKVLFLRPSQRAVKAPRVELSAQADADMQGLTTAAPARIFEDSGLVSKVNFDAQDAETLDENESELPWTDNLSTDGLGEDDMHDEYSDIDVEEMFVERRAPGRVSPLQPTPMRRATDRPGGVLTLSEVYDNDDDYKAPQVNLEDVLAVDADAPLIENIDGLNLDIGSDVDVSDEESFDDLVLSEVDFVDEPIETDNRVIDNLDPSDLITSHIGRANDDVELSELEDPGPSPIATAAAEVSGRLDALMANEQDGIVETEKKILPFRSKKTIDSETLGSDNPVYDTLIEPEALDGRDAPQELSALDLIKDDIETDNFPDLTAQKDSAARYIARNIAPAQRKKRQTGLSFMVIFGMILFAVSVATMLSGYDQRFGAGGEFLSTVGAILGGMISLGCIYYILKNMSLAD